MTATSNFAYTLLAKWWCRHVMLGDFELCAAAVPFGPRPKSIFPACGILKTTVVVLFSQGFSGPTGDGVDADMLAVLRQAVSVLNGMKSSFFDAPAQVWRIKHEVAHEVVSEVAARPHNVVALAPGAILKTPSGTLRCAYALSLVA